MAWIRNGDNNVMAIERECVKRRINVKDCSLGRNRSVLAVAHEQRDEVQQWWQEPRKRCPPNQFFGVDPRVRQLGSKPAPPQFGFGFALGKLLHQ